ncbi:hypothetical protein D9M69_664400 [compost metagenome]
MVGRQTRPLCDTAYRRYPEVYAGIGRAEVYLRPPEFLNALHFEDLRLHNFPSELSAIRKQHCSGEIGQGIGS